MRIGHLSYLSTFTQKTFRSTHLPNPRTLLPNTRPGEFALENTVEFPDINLLVSRNGFLREEFTYDAIHLNPRGDALWAPEVGRVLTQPNL